MQKVAQTKLQKIEAGRWSRYKICFANFTRPPVVRHIKWWSLRKSEKPCGAKRCIETTLFLMMIVFIGCSGSGSIDINLDNPQFPSSGGKAGGTADSSSTNFSQKVFDPKTKADATSQTGFVAPPNASNYGAVSFNYGIEVPPGRAGVQPQISLGYSSSGGDGWVGIGWSIGVGAISRTTQYGQLYYDKRDTFTYNGKRLVKVSGSTTNEDGVYRCEIEDGSFKKLTLTGVGSGGVWMVFGSDGSRTIFGESLSHRVRHPDDATKTYTWNFSRTTDINGNYMYAVYDDSEYAVNHILYLKELRYTGNSTQGLDAYQYIRFETSARNSDDIYVSKAAEFVMKMTRLLTRIEVGWHKPGDFFETELWDYDLSYETSADSNRPLLVTVESSRTTTTPRFRYQPAVHQFVWQNINNIWAGETETNPEASLYFEGDFNGDAKSDMAFFNPETGDFKVVESKFTGGVNFKTYGNKFQGYGAGRIQWFKDNATGDYDGNAKSDIAFYLPEEKEFWVAESTGSNFQFKKYGTFTLSDKLDLFKAEWFTGDYDSNGISDVLLFDETTGNWWLMLSKKGSFEFLKVAENFRYLYRNDYVPAIGQNAATTFDTSENGLDKSKIKWLIGDYNGDGRTDISFYDQRSGKWWVGENYRDDGAPSGFRQDWKLYKIFTAPEQAMFSLHRFSGDFNGDGLSDFLMFDSATGKWWLGATGVSIQPDGYSTTGTINFQVFGQAPQFKNMTRWLQGDFNGDGRTDIGFYSNSDNNFWIGEATPSGFRYRIYTNINFGGPGSSILDAPPLKDLVKFTKKKAIRNINGSNTVVIDYAYDGNLDSSRGEDVFTGCFSGNINCNTLPEMLVYDRKADGYFIKKGINTTPATAAGTLVSLTDNNSTVLNADFNKSFTGNGQDELLVYNKTATNHNFIVVKSDTNASSLSEETLFSFGNGVIQNFSITKSVHLINNFNATPKQELLVIDDLNTDGLPNSAEVHLISDTSPGPPLTIDYRTSGLNLYQIFGANRENRDKFRFFSGNFSGSTAKEILMVDQRVSNDVWYLGVLAAGNINFYKLSGTVNLPEKADFGPLKQTRNLGLSKEALLYAVTTNGQTSLTRLDVSGSLPNGPFTISQINYGALSSSYQFKWDFDTTGKAIVGIAGSTDYKSVRFNATNLTIASLSLGQSNFLAAAIDRTDLYNKTYKFQWIQGDYNGDGKTDLGFFHLKESKWYFAMTQGTVPDLIEKVENGIGGTYTFEYKNSSSYDNTGVDNIPDLPVNYKVCSKILLEDGQGNRVTNNYDYSDGYTFSDFIANRKETDYFGFGKFTTTNAYGERTIEEYHNVPFANYLHNRALAGALKTSRYVGGDSIEYSRKKNEYQVDEITTGATAKSFWVYTKGVREFGKGVATKTTQNAYTQSNYQLQSQQMTLTDHYSDTAHAQETITTRTLIDTVTSTNQQRPANVKNLLGTAYETTMIYQYDGLGNVSKETLSYTGSGLAAVLDRHTEYEYDGFGNRTATTNTSENPNRRSEITYDSILQQFVVIEKILKTSGSLDQTYNINYASAFGAPDIVTDANGNKQYFSYDSNGRIVRVRADTEAGTETLADYSYDVNYPVSAYTIQYAGASSSATSDVETRVYADGMGRGIHSIESAQGSGGQLYTKGGHITYDNAGRVIRQSQPNWAANDEISTFRPASAERNPSYTVYDASGRVSKVTSPPAFSGEAETSVTTIYNDPFIVTTTHSIGQGKTTEIDGRGRTLYVTDFGNKTSGALSVKMGFCYDIANNMTKRSDLVATSMNCNVPTAVFSTTAGDSSGNNISYFQFDGYKQTVAKSDPDTGVSHFLYNNFGEVVHKQDALNRHTDYQYDRLGRVSKKTLPPGEGQVVYFWDAISSQTGTSGVGANGRGLLVGYEDISGRVELGYDKLGRKALEVRQLREASGNNLENAFVTRMKYDLLDRATEVDYPQDPSTSSKMRVCYGYNRFGLVSSVFVNTTASDSGCSSNRKAIVSLIQYNEYKQVDIIKRGNGIDSRYLYDDKRRITKLIYEKNSNRLTETDYIYNIQNSITRKVTNPIGANASFQDYSTDLNYNYDALNRLIQARGQSFTAELSSGHIAKQYQLNYSYSQIGNITSKEKRDFATGILQDRWDYSYTSHKVNNITSSKYGGQRFSLIYDAVGNTTSRIDQAPEQKPYQDTTPPAGLLHNVQLYDSYNRITSVINGSTLEVKGEYTYDDAGYRTRRLSHQIVEGQERIYEIESPCKYFSLERQKDILGSPLPNTEYSVNQIYLNGLRVAAVVPGGAARYFLVDQVDSVHVVTDDAGIAINRTEYLPYGETWFVEGEKNFLPKFNSQELDKESDLYFFNARHYDPEIARFVTADTVIDGNNAYASWNRFMYVSGNPVRYKDPSGNKKKKISAFKQLQDGEVVSKVKYNRRKKSKVTLSSGRVIKDKTAVIKFIKAKFKRNTKQWLKMKRLSGNHSRKIKVGKRVKKINQYWRADVPGKRAWHGPNARFRVTNVTAGRKKREKDSPVQGWGSMIEFEVLGEDDKVVGKLRFIHLTEINSEILEASETNTILAPGTLVGSTGRNAGITDGQHLHLESVGKRIKRKKILKLLQGKVKK